MKDNRIFFLLPPFCYYILSISTKSKILTLHSLPLYPDHPPHLCARFYGRAVSLKYLKRSSFPLVLLNFF